MDGQGEGRGSNEACPILSSLSKISLSFFPPQRKVRIDGICPTRPNRCPKALGRGKETFLLNFLLTSPLPLGASPPENAACELLACSESSQGEGQGG